MRKFIFISLFFAALGIQAQSKADSASLKNVLNKFLADAWKEDTAINDKFWAEGLIYTRPDGRRMSKAELMRSLAPRFLPTSHGPGKRYSAEDMQIKLRGNTGMAAFTLVYSMISDRGNVTNVQKFKNTATFLKIKGKWKAIAWQSAAIPPDEETAKGIVAKLNSNFFDIMQYGNSTYLQGICDETFIWTNDTGKKIARKELVNLIESGEYRYPRIINKSPEISIYGDTAVVRGKASFQSSPTQDGKIPAITLFEIFYTTTFIRKDGYWRAIAMQSGKEQKLP